jgi:metal-responsive CopG/Arc/MetJ family transcriptional regulator
MKRTAKVAVSLPVETLRRLDRESRRTGQARSAVVTRAVQAWLDQQEVSEQDRRYLEGYLRQPEPTTEAVAAAVTAIWEPWT